VPALQIPPGFSFQQEPTFFINNQTGLKPVHVATHPTAIDGVGIGILRTTGAGRVFVDTSVIHDESEFFYGIRLTREDLNFNADEDEEEADEDEGIKAGTDGVGSLNLDPDA
jgi:hypothetical protein